MAAYYINALLTGYSWTPTGTKTNLTYSFLRFNPSYSIETGFSPFTADEQQSALRAMKEVSTFANVNFSNINQTSANVGTITWGNADLNAGYAEYAYYPSSHPLGGDIWVDTDYASSYSTGDHIVDAYMDALTMHELGHALGLKHSFEGPNALTGSEDSYQYTLMSYNASSYYRPYPSSYMLYDIAALQYMYGANMNYNSGNNTYDYKYISATRCIWDAGGNDTLDASASADRVIINLNAGSFSSIGHTYSGNLNDNNLAIAFNCVIENANGGAGNDFLLGNAVANKLIGNSGDDYLHGKDGNDTLYGGNGNDVVLGGNGNDTIYGGSGNDQIWGDANNDTIIGDSGSDQIDGGTGIDTVSYSGSTAAVNVNIAKTTAQAGGYAAGDTLISIENIIGSSYNDSLFGNALANVINGGKGKDTMTGGGGADYFKFSAITDSGKATGARDYITDFVNGTDKIDLANFAGSFVFKGTGAFTHTAHEVNYAKIGSNTILSIDADGNGLLDFQIELAGLHNITASDFLL